MNFMAISRLRELYSKLMFLFSSYLRTCIWRSATSLPTLLLAPVFCLFVPLFLSTTIASSAGRRQTKSRKPWSGEHASLWGCGAVLSSSKREAAGGYPVLRQPGVFSLCCYCPGAPERAAGSAEPLAAALLPSSGWKQRSPVPFPFPRLLETPLVTAERRVYSS